VAISRIDTNAIAQIRLLADRYRTQANAARASAAGYVARAQDQYQEEDDCNTLALNLASAANALEAALDPRAEALDVREPKP
jgi:hypothetical protein